MNNTIKPDQLCQEIPELGVKLTQSGMDSFSVTYGKQIKCGLSYNQAACEYVACIMHALAWHRLDVDACAQIGSSKLDNRQEGETDL